MRKLLLFLMLKFLPLLVNLQPMGGESGGRDMEDRGDKGDRGDKEDEGDGGGKEVLMTND